MARLAKVGLPAIAAWWALLVGVWLITLSSITESELIVAVVSALPCAVAARAGGRLALAGAPGLGPMAAVLACRGLRLGVHGQPGQLRAEQHLSCWGRPGR